MNGVACRKLLFELSENTLSSAEGIERSSTRSLDNGGESNECAKRAPVKNQPRVENSTTSETPSEKAATSVNEETTRSTRDAILVESWSQTDDGVVSVTGKKQLTNVGRKMTASSTLYTKKMARSLSVSNASETKSTFSSVSSVPAAKRFPTCVSPRKPVPGRNVGAAVFVPGKKIIPNSVKSAATNDAKTGSVLCDSAVEKTKIPRSKSDPVFDTSANCTKKISVEEKPYLSAECVKNDRDKDSFCCRVDSLTTSLSSPVHSLRVIDEGATASKVVVVGVKACDEPPNSNGVEKRGDDVCKKANGMYSVGDSASSAILVGKTSSAKTTASVIRVAPKTPVKNDSRPPSITVNNNVNEDDKTQTLITTTTTTTNGEKKNDALKKNSRIAIGNSSFITGHGAARSRQNDGNNRVGGGSFNTLERRPANVSSLPKPKQTTAQSHCPPYQGNAATKHFGSVSGLIATKSNDQVKKTKANATWLTKDAPSRDSEKWRSLKERNNHNYSTTAAKPNASPGGFKRNGHVRHSCNITRSKTSVDLKYTDVENRAAAHHAAANSSRSAGNKDDDNVKNCETDCSPRRRRGSKDTDGWETVISKSRRSIPNSFSGGAKNKSFDVNNRFYEPSSSTSLPILVLEDDGFGAGSTTTAANDKIVQKQQPQHHQQQQQQHQHHHHHHHHHRHIEVKSKSALEMKSHNKNRNRNNSHGSNNSTGNRDSICTTDTPSENGHQTVDGYSRTVGIDYDDYKLRKERPIISSTAMFTTIQPKRKKLNDKENRKTKGAGKENKIGGNCGGSGSGSKTVDSKESTNERGGEDLSDDEESLRKSKELYEKEISLQKEINELQKDADLETDGDADADADADVDVDADIDADSDSTEVDQEIVDLCSNNNDEARRSTLEMKYEHILANMTWAERAITLDKLEELLLRDPSGKFLKFAKKLTSLKQLEDLVSRAPGRALELHQKLSSPSRKRISPDTTILQHKARQAKAKRNREQLLQDKSAKLRELFNKVSQPLDFIVQVH